MIMSQKDIFRKNMGVFVRWLKFILIDVHLIVVAVLAAFGAVVALLFMFV